jgi:hypothetical protein
LLVKVRLASEAHRRLVVQQLDFAEMVQRLVTMIKTLRVYERTQQDSDALLKGCLEFVDNIMEFDPCYA